MSRNKQPALSPRRLAREKNWIVVWAAESVSPDLCDLPTGRRAQQRERQDIHDTESGSHQNHELKAIRLIAQKIKKEDGSRGPTC